MTPNTVVPIHFTADLDQRTKIALDAMPIAVAWARLDNGKVEFMNSRFIQMFGYNPAEVTDVFHLIVDMFADKEHGQRAIEQLQQFVGQNVFERFDLPTEEILINRKDGSQVFIRFSGVILPEANMSLATFVDISDTKEKEEQLQRIATEEALTGLMNRRSFDQEFSSLIGAAELGKRFSLLMLDLDGFKAANDTFGHDAGDEVLRRFADILRASVRKDDLICRWGGDEFSVLLRSPCPDDVIFDVLNRVRHALSKPLIIAGKPVNIGVSAGYGFYPDHGRTMSDLYRYADRAMFEIKHAKKRAAGNPD